ncbi:hypothetical protein D7Y41_07895 [Anaerotruncus sp. 1XD22-93]|nr:hypothetical protein D7Y41_07895 [Anaerotruncus sp. 1XD22-93]
MQPKTPGGIPGIPPGVFGRVKRRGGDMIYKKPVQALSFVCPARRTGVPPIRQANSCCLFYLVVRDGVCIQLVIRIAPSRLAWLYYKRQI